MSKRISLISSRLIQFSSCNNHKYPYRENNITKAGHLTKSHWRCEHSECWTISYVPHIKICFRFILNYNVVNTVHCFLFTSTLTTGCIWYELFVFEFVESSIAPPLWCVSALEVSSVDKVLLTTSDAPALFVVSSSTILSSDGKWLVMLAIGIDASEIYKENGWYECKTYQHFLSSWQRWNISTYLFIIFNCTNIC